MKLSYFPEVDSLYIDLAGKPGSDVIEVAQNVVMDVDERQPGGNPNRSEGQQYR
jgi:uncharacterized protein YuzE